MDKGTRIRIVKGRKGRGVVGTVFWEGPNNWGEGTRLGVEGDDGETYWVASDNVEPLDKKEDPGLPPSPDVPKGARVSWKRGGDAGTGVVFWVGKGKNGRARVGLNDDETEETLWLDTRLVTVMEDDAPAARPERRQSQASSYTSHAAPAHEPYPHDDDEPPPLEPWSGPVGEPPPMDEPPPYDYSPIDDDDDMAF